MKDIDVQSKFIEELNALIVKYKVEMSIECNVSGQGLINFWAYAQYDENHEMIAEHIDYSTGWLCWKDF